MPDPADPVVIVGAGHAGDAAAALLRQYGFPGTITLLGEEAFAPYHRPPLSKAWLKGEADAAALALRGPNFYERQDIALRLDTRVTGLDRGGKRVLLADGTSLPYAALILATGAHARALDIPGASMAHVHSVRTRADADALRAALAASRHLAIVGGGYIGLEIAASARALGVAVTVIEREARLLARVASPPLAAAFQRLHEAQGVKFHLNAGIAAIEPAAVILADGTALAADNVVIGVGAVPTTQLAASAGLDCANGVVVDMAARTSDPDIFAIGDCAARPLPRYDRRLRLESVPNTLEQAKQAAAAITARTPPPPETPWFWSDQYSVRLQIAGLLLDVTQTIARGDPGDAKFALFHLTADGTLQAVEAVNAAEEFMAGRLMIARRAKPSPAALADLATPMRAILA